MLGMVKKQIGPQIPVSCQGKGSSVEAHKDKKELPRKPPDPGVWYTKRDQ